jgi:mRNA interferase MazF
MRSRIQTVICVVITSAPRRAQAPGNVVLYAESTGLPRDSVADVSQLVTLDRSDLSERIGSVSPSLMRQVDSGLRLVMGLGV